MNIKYADGFKRSFRKLPNDIQEKFYDKVEILQNNIRHPSLHAKKYDEQKDVWQARVDRSYRMYFKIEDDSYIILEVRPHPK